MKPVRIPRRIDEPPYLLMWPIDEILPILMGLAVGIFIGSVFWTLLLGWLISKAYKKKKESNPDGFFFHIFYWYTGLSFNKLRTMINPFIKRLFP